MLDPKLTMTAEAGKRDLNIQSVEKTISRTTRSSFLFLLQLPSSPA
jgi:hypothetical protein